MNYAGVVQALGFRFERVRQVAREGGVISCRAHDLLAHRQVGLRVCLPSANDADRDAFSREAEALQLIGAHPAVVGLTEVVSHGELNILVLEDAEPGVSVPVSPREAVRTVLTLAGAVETAHRVGVLHGRIEPAAVWLAPTGRPMLAGFWGRLEDPQPPVLHEASSHTAPEVLLGEPPDASVDVYGLGSTLYELLAGTSAIRSYPGESAAALALRVLTGTTAQLDRSAVPFSLADVVGWCMAVERAERPPSVAWLAEELGRVERSQGWPRTRVEIGAHPEPPARRRVTRHRA